MRAAVVSVRVRDTVRGAVGRGWIDPVAGGGLRGGESAAATEP